MHQELVQAVAAFVYAAACLTMCVQPDKSPISERPALLK